MSLSKVAMLLLSVVLLGGCVTEKIEGPALVKTSMGPDDTPRVSREQDLLSKVEADPKDVKAWFELGDYYETGMLLDKAIEAYEKGAALVDDTHYTGGHYVLARCYFRVQSFQQAFAHLEKIAQLEPKDPRSACLNPHFKESHYLRGAIYYLHAQWAPAKKEFVRFLELGGDEVRVAEWLEKLENEKD